MWQALVCLVLGACAEQPSARVVHGSRADVMTASGTYPGYDVETSCLLGYPEIGIIGTGSQVVTDRAEVLAFGDELVTSLDLRSIRGRGTGKLCTSEAADGAAWIYTDDWRDVDAIIERAGALLRDGDLALEVGISVGLPLII